MTPSLSVSESDNSTELNFLEMYSITGAYNRPRKRGPQLRKGCGMSGVKKIIALGAFLFGAVNAQQVVRSDAETGQKHVGCYYGVWAYTR